MSVETPKTSSLAEMRQNAMAPEANLPEIQVGFDNLRSFDLIQRAAKLLASSSLVPQIYQGNVANCVIALNMASRIGADPLMVMQNLFVVQGKPGWSSQFLIATFNTCGRYSSLRYEFFGERGTDDWGCRAWAIEKATAEKIYGADVTIRIAKQEKWTEKNGSKWQTMPQQMLQYRAASWFVRTYAPELAMGLHSVEEIRDVGGDNLDAGLTIEQLRQQPIDTETGEIKTDEKPKKA
jgi:hypothetical protein